MEVTEIGSLKQPLEGCAIELESDGTLHSVGGVGVDGNVKNLSVLFLLRCGLLPLIQ